MGKSKNSQRKGSHRLGGRLGDWEIGVGATSWPGLALSFTTPGSNAQNFSLVQIVPSASASPGQVGQVEMLVEMRVDWLSVTGAGFYVFGFGLYKAKYDQPSSQFLPITISPNNAIDACRDKFWMYGPMVRPTFLPTQTNVTVPVELSWSHRIPNMVLSEGEALILSLAAVGPTGGVALGALQCRYKQRRLL